MIYASLVVCGLCWSSHTDSARSVYPICTVQDCTHTEQNLYAAIESLGKDVNIWESTKPLLFPCSISSQSKQQPGGQSILDLLVPFPPVCFLQTCPWEGLKVQPGLSSCFCYEGLQQWGAEGRKRQNLRRPFYSGAGNSPYMTTGCVCWLSFCLREWFVVLGRAETFFRKWQ